MYLHFYKSAADWNDPSRNILIFQFACWRTEPRMTHLPELMRSMILMLLMDYCNCEAMFLKIVRLLGQPEIRYQLLLRMIDLMDFLFVVMNSFQAENCRKISLAICTGADGLSVE